MFAIFRENFRKKCAIFSDTVRSNLYCFLRWVPLKDAWACIEPHGHELRCMGAHGGAWTRTTVKGHAVAGAVFRAEMLRHWTGVSKKLLRTTHVNATRNGTAWMRMLVSCGEVVVIFGPVAIFNSSSLHISFTCRLSVSLSVQPSVCDVGGSWLHRSEMLETNCKDK